MKRSVIFTTLVITLMTLFSIGKTSASYSVSVLTIPDMFYPVELLTLCTDGTSRTGCHPSITVNTAGLIKTTTIGTGNPGDPVIAFIDVQAGPNVGWSAAEPNKGAVITIYGRNFGAVGNRGSNYVTVNGVNLTSASSYVDTWAETNNPVSFLK